MGLTTAALVAAVFFFLLATLPPNPASISLDNVDPALRARTISGAYHVHTSRSDGAADKMSVAAAAARAAQQFVIFTDHGDAMHTPDPPVYLSGVLCIDAVEISTTRGHYVALDLPAAPYPLAGEPAAVVEDVKRLGGFGVAAHPDHPKPELSWTEWDLPIDGIEWLNADVEWRNESRLQLFRVLFDYLVRPGPALASVFERPDRTFGHWDRLEAVRPVVGLAAADAHGAGRNRRQEGDARSFNAGPGYEASFRSLSNRVLIDRPLSGDPGQDARLVLDAIRQGRVYAVVDAISRDVVLTRDETGRFGLASAALPGLEVRTTGSSSRPRLELQTARAPGDPPVPWVVGNWSGNQQPPAIAMPFPTGTPAITGSERLKLTSEWRVEKDPVSSGKVSGIDGGATLRYQLAPGSRVSQFVAAAADLDPGASFNAIAFRGSSERPMRVSVQVRLRPDDSRWVRSVYLDPTSRDVALTLSNFRPAEGGVAGVPDASRARSILFVVDLVNARPGDTGAFAIEDLRVSR